jgi:hypothetical protein
MAKTYVLKFWIFISLSICQQFISEVTKKKKPVYLDYYGDDWYAELTCTNGYLLWRISPGSR